MANEMVNAFQTNATQKYAQTNIDFKSENIYILLLTSVSREGHIGVAIYEKLSSMLSSMWIRDIRSDMRSQDAQCPKSNKFIFGNLKIEIKVRINSSEKKIRSNIQSEKTINRKNY